eukprot:791087-Amorphochlora_amoeboformis.AAC.1
MAAKLERLKVDWSRQNEMKVQDTIGVSGEGGEFLHGGGIAVCTYYLVDILGPHEVAHLGARIHAVEGRSSERVPEAYTAVSCAAP